MSRRRRGRPLDGVLLVDKPIGPTSHDVCRRVQRALNAEKAGHTGTLDPMATGLLEVCLGKATRLAPFLTAETKTYLAHLKLGVATTTLDREGEITTEDAPEAVAAVDAAAFAAILPQFLGDVEQRPPIFSAIKVDGQRLHALARAGTPVEAPLRTIHIEALELVDAAPPVFAFRVRCSKGTYVRSLGADLAAALGLSGHLVGLRREANGRREVANALTLEAIEADPEAAIAALWPLAHAVSHLPTIHLPAALVPVVRQGQRPVVPGAPVGQARALDPEGRLVAIVEASDEGLLTVVRGFPADDEPSPPEGETEATAAL